mmetsp:Transcript_4815/g.11847  ORF Transcript_4815/g.11847 Transcript_4815/m.11847 type:complete len:531 (-) Transcript_4815:417-2009(-)|eukprot:CAMPEP_0178994584 /NCGR_PEP_ID=MMETSP0795-20121207/7352_1 /TAXON_ID=88552 /ORGANISM="Amoebophrya sp., Strain Ameob2" /LENGTH=530 /DNA_ID=CAMNT_0020686795 /DNA_START=374 /DNA_END=1966 /DNA_ORIENTATION=-
MTDHTSDRKVSPEMLEDEGVEGGRTNPTSAADGKQSPDAAIVTGTVVPTSASSAAPLVRRSSRTFSDAEIPDWAARPATAEERKNGFRSKETALPVHVTFWVQQWKVVAKDGHELIEMKMRLLITWRDYRLANWSLEEEVPPDIWKPEIFIVGEGGMDIDDKDLEKPPSFATRERHNGELEWILFTKETQFEVLSSADGLRSFPFDSARYDFIVCLSGEKRLEGSPEVRFEFEKSCSQAMYVPVTDPQKCTSGDFDLVGISYAKGAHVSQANPDGYEDLLLSLHVKRNPKFYLFKTCFPLYAILVFGSLSYCLEVADLSGRLNLIFAMFLTCFALQWIVLDRLPRVPYMTVLDGIITIVNGSLLLMGLGSALCALVLSRDRFSLWSDGLASSSSSGSSSSSSSGDSTSGGNAGEAEEQLLQQLQNNAPTYSMSQLRTADRIDQVMSFVVLLVVVGLHLYVYVGVRKARSLEGLHRPWSEGPRSWVKTIEDPRYVAFPLKPNLFFQNKEEQRRKNQEEIFRVYLGEKKDVF